MEEMIRILQLSDPTVGPVPDTLEDPTLSSGERIERFLDIFASIWEVANASEERVPKRASASTKQRP